MTNRPNQPSDQRYPNAAESSRSDSESTDRSPLVSSSPDDSTRDPELNRASGDGTANGGERRRALVKTSVQELMQVDESAGRATATEESNWNRSGSERSSEFDGEWNSDREQRRSRSSRSSSYQRGSHSSGGRSSSRRSSDSSRRSSRKRRRRSRQEDAGRLGFVGSVVLIGVAMVSPWLLGSVSPLLTFALLIAFAALVGIWWSYVALKGGQALRLPWNIVPLFLAVGLAVFQLVPLPSSWLETLAPQQQEWRRELGWIPAQVDAEADNTESIDDGASEDASHIDVSEVSLNSDVPTANEADDLPLEPIHSQAGGHPLSLNPTGTRHDLTLLLVAISAFCCGAVFLYRRTPFQAMLIAFSINGLLLALFGLIQRFTWNGHLYWFIPTGDRLPFASFINSNHAGGYLNMCLACAMGVVFIAFFKGSSERARRESIDRMDGWDDYGMGNGIAGVLLHRIGRFIAELSVWKLTTLVIVGVLVISVMLSLSRGATLACFISLLLTALLLLTSRRHRWVGLGFGVLFLLAIPVTMFLGEMQSVQTELATIAEQDYEDDLRINLLADVTPHWQSHFWVGSGLGSFRNVYRMYRPDSHDAWFYHAENQYLESFFDAGFMGLGLLLLLFIWALWQATYLIRYGDSTAEVALGMTMAFALFSQGIQAAFDFGLYVPSNFILLAILCGAGAAASHRLADARRHARFRRTLRQNYDLSEKELAAAARRLKRRTIPALIAWLIPIGLFAGLIAMASPAERQVELAFAEKDGAEMIRATRKSESIDESEMVEVANRLQATSAASRDGGGYRQLGELYVALYRRAATERLRTQTKRSSKPLSWEEAYKATSLISLHGQVQKSYREGAESDVDRQRESELTLRYLVPALESFQAARQYSPFTATNYLRIAELTFLVDDPDLNQRWVDRAVKLAPGRCDILFDAGLVEAQAGRLENARSLWGRSLKNSEEFQIPILQLSGQLLADEVVQEEFLPQDFRGMTRLIRRLQKAELEVALSPRLQQALVNQAELLYVQQWLDSKKELRERDFLIWREIRLISPLKDAKGNRNSEQMLALAELLPPLSEVPDMEEFLLGGLEADPDSTELKYCLAFNYLEAGDLDMAFEFINECVREQPSRKKYQDLRKKVIALRNSGRELTKVDSRYRPLDRGIFKRSDPCCDSAPTVNLTRKSPQVITHKTSNYETRPHKTKPRKSLFAADYPPSTPPSSRGLRPQSLESFPLHSDSSSHRLFLCSDLCT